MNSLWTILIDVSGSMNDGFSGSGKPTGLVEKGNWRRKLDAAKDILYQQTSSLFETEVAIIKFNNNAELIYKGKPTDDKKIRDRIYSLSAGGGTNIASGLLLALNTLNFERYSAITILIITDGLSNEGDPIEAAREIVRKFPSIRISTILIDVTEKGKDIARKISINGDVRYAQSFQQLSKETKNEGLQNLYKSIRKSENIIGEHEDAVFSFITKKSFFQRELEIASEADTKEYPRSKIQPRRFEFTNTNPVGFNVDYLDNQIVPYLRSLENVQTTLDQIREQPSRVRIQAITKYSPVKATVSGIAQALEIVERMVIPWKREHAKTIAKLEEREKELQIKKSEADLLESKAKAQNQDLNNDILFEELRIKRAEAEKLEIANERDKLAFMKEKVIFVRDILREFASNLPEEERTVYIMKMMKSLDELIQSPLEIKQIDRQ